MDISFRVIVTTLLIVFSRAGKMLLELAPYVITGTALGELLKYTSWTRIAYKALSGNPIVSIFGAVIAGVASPLCTYGTVPVALRLSGEGVHIAPLMAFLSSSALMNPQLFILTWGGLGPEIAVARLASVMLFGIIFGLVLRAVPQQWIRKKSTNTSDAGREEILSKSSKKPGLASYMKGFTDSLAYFGFYIVVGILLGAAVEVLVPSDWIANTFRPGEWFSVLLASFMGIPLYACGGGAIPLLQAFMSQGMSRGAALGFMIVGQGTRITPIASLCAVMRPPAIVMYVVFLVLFALVVGVAFG